MLRTARLAAAGLAGLVALSLAPAAATGAVPTASPAPAAVQSPAGHAVAAHDHAVADHDHDADEHGEEACEQHTPPAVPGGPQACAHADEPPPGVDVTRVPTTAELRQREGAAEAAVDAAQDAGVPTAAQLASGSTVPCDGDGRSGYRVQGVYVVTAARANRYAELRDRMQSWAAGVEDVVNRSAAQTGGVRHVRFATTGNADGTCTPSVLQVTLPAGADASFGATISAMQAQGYTDPARKYLMWVDGSGYCGIAQMYYDSRHGQENVNNGSYPMFARVDAACWGAAYSVEAHELEHTLGGVQNTSPHHSPNGHCTDESDRMCYVDAAGVVMHQVCPPENEALLDCGNDDYFSTYPSAGSYLAGNWNSADSRFLIGGGNGTTGGSTGVPTRLAVGISVNNPAVAGLPTQVTARPEDVPGRTVQVSWKAGRSDCTFADPTAVQTTVTCSAASSAGTTVTVTAADGLGTAAASSPLTFSSSVRTAGLSSAVDGAQGAATLGVCPGALVPVTATVTDEASGVAVKGARVEVVRTLAGVTSLVGSATTGADGRALTRATATPGATLTVRTALTGVFSARTGQSTALVSAGTCATAVTSSLAEDTVGHGSPVVVTGTVTAAVAGRTVPVVDDLVQLALTPAGSATATLLVSGRTGTDGTYRLAATGTTSGTLTVRHPVTAAHAASAGAPTALTVYPYTTAVAGALSAPRLPYGAVLTVTGTVTRTGNGVTSPAAGRAVVVRQYGPTGAQLGAVSVTTAADGTYRAALTVRASGSVLVGVVPAAGYGASSTAPLPLEVTPYTTALQVTGSAPSAVAYRGPVRVTGGVTRTWDGATGPAAGLPVVVRLAPASGAPSVVVGSGTTTSTGAFAVTATPSVTGSLTVTLSGVPGHLDAPAQPAGTVTVAAALTLTSSTTAPAAGAAVTFTAGMAPARAAATPLLLQRQLAGGAWTTVAALPVTGGTGRVVVPAGGAGTWAYRVVFEGDRDNAAAVSAVRTLRVL